MKTSCLTNDEILTEIGKTKRKLDFVLYFPINKLMINNI